MGIPASNTNSGAEPSESTMQDGGPKRTESSASKMSIKSAVSVFRGGLKKLSNTLKPHESDPPSDYQRFVRDKSPSKDVKADPFVEAIADRVAKGMHGEFDNERQAIAIKLRAKQIGVEKQDQLEQKRVERRRKAAEKEKREKTNEAEKQTRREDEEEGARMRKAERMDQEGWAGFNEDGTLKSKSGMDPLLEKRLRQAAKAQGKTYTGEDELEGESYDASRVEVEATASSSEESNESRASSKAEHQRREQSQREASSVADYFSNKDSSGRHRSPASKTATEAFGPASTKPSHQIPRKPVPGAASHRDTNFGDLISEAKGEVPQVPLPTKLREIGGKWAYSASRSIERIGRRGSANSELSFSCAGVPSGTGAGEGLRCASCGAELRRDGERWETCRECSRRK
ncbi:hypothetical protein EV356DRAFT_164374 [Viridothelium virens]|uniref:Uncharacterized protein n=1 Tax=Viridothelium virens TaxID=1048519 RepID=A0A6A6HLV6_VIRVR|nr:hypothetical protein EV356DRAFT_164374 [Viridothelium virens]